MPRDSDSLAQTLPRLLLALVLTISLAAPVLAQSAATLRTFPAGAGRLAYAVSGHGPTVVLLAGGPGFEPRYLDPVAGALARDHRVVVFHQRGTGASREAAADRTRLTVAGAVADLDALRVALGRAPLVIVGHSWGGMLAMAYTVAHPRSVARLVLVDPGPVSRGSFARVDAEQDRRLNAADHERLRAALAQHDDSAIIASTFPAAFADRRHVRSLTRFTQRRFVNPVAFEAIGADLAQHYDLRAGLRRVRAPVYIVVGAADPQRFAADEIAALVPRHGLVVIAGAGHYPWLEAPGETLGAIRAFSTSGPVRR